MCVDCVLVFCVSVGIMSDTQHAVVSCDYIQTYYSWSNCVCTVFQFFTVCMEYMYPTWCAVPSVMASHLCLESGATERPVSLTKQVPTTGGVCVYACVCNGIT